MSQRLADRFAACREDGRIAFVGFVTAGFPNLADTVPAMLEMEKQGADRFRSHFLPVAICAVGLCCA
mgnify:CR=1 FL=1